MINWCGYKWDTTMEGGRRIHPDEPWMWFDSECTTVDSDGILHLKLQYKPTTIHHWDGMTYNPTIATGVLRSHTPMGCGTYSADIKLPKGMNLWPAFWLTGYKSWPPEIDIVEGWTEDKGSYSRWTKPQFPWLCPNWKTNTDIHWRGDINNSVDNAYFEDKYGEFQYEHIGSRPVSKCKQPKNPADNFVNYKLVWTPDEISIYYNNNLVRQLTGKSARELYENTPDPRMYTVFDLWCEDPTFNKVSMDTEMLAKNFEYTPISE